MADGLIDQPPLPFGGEKFGAWFDYNAAAQAADFFPRYIRHTEGEWAGQPFELNNSQRQIVHQVFGWKREDGTRLIRTLYLEIPRKNGKTEFAAGLALMLLLADSEMGGQVYSMAVDKDQAKLVQTKAGVMVGYNPDLQGSLEVYKTSIYCPSLMARFEAISSTPGSKHGFHPSAAIADELHAWPDGELYQVVHDGMAGRRQPLEILITTAGVAGQGFGWETHEYALSVLAKTTVDPSFLAIIFAADPKDDWTDEGVWAKANPNLGVSPKLDFLRSQCEKAKHSPRLENNFKRYHLNLWTAQAVRWIPMEDYAACQAVPQSLSDLAGRHCYGGLDLSSTTDITALVLVFPRSGGFDIFCRFWLPKAGLKERIRRDRRPYDKWAADGYLTLTDGNVVDYDKIRDEITAEIITTVDLRELAIDRWNATQITTQLMDDGITVAQFGQGFASMSGPSKELEKLILQHAINHMGNPILEWMMGCAEIKSDPAGNIKPIKPDRQKSKARIDGVIATIMAIARAIVPDENPTGPSVYENAGVAV